MRILYHGRALRLGEQIPEEVFSLRMRPRPPSPSDVFELRVKLRHIEPPIWRELRVPAKATLAELHEALQTAFGWQNRHLHDFLIGDVRFGVVEADSGRLVVAEGAAPLGAVARVGSTFLYRYDYGDNWEHDVVVERVVAGAEGVIVCVDGARACPPEDCGGPHGYAHLLEVLANPKDEEHAEMKAWVGPGFDPERFVTGAVKKKLSKRTGTNVVPIGRRPRR
jgi:hypothetical protein